MAGPWEKYRKQQPADAQATDAQAAPRGPWEKYGAEPSAPAALPEQAAPQPGGFDYSAYRAQIGDPLSPGAMPPPSVHIGGMVEGGPQGNPHAATLPPQPDPTPAPRTTLGSGDPVRDARAEVEMTRPGSFVESLAMTPARLGRSAAENTVGLLGIGDELEGGATAIAQGFRNAAEAVGSLIGGDAPEYGDIGAAYEYGRQKFKARRELRRADDPVTEGAGAVLSVATTLPAKGAIAAKGLIAGAKQAAKVSTLFGGVAGFGHADGDIVDRAVGTVVGAGTGAVTGFGLGFAMPPLLQGIGKLGGMGAGLLQRAAGSAPGAKMTAAERGALRTVFNAFMDDGIGPMEAARRLRAWRAQGGAPAQLVDLGGDNVRRLARAIGTAGGRGSTAVMNEAERRLAQQADEISNALAKTLSGKGDYLAAVSQLDAMRKGIAAPLYKAAYSEQVNVTPRMGELLNRPHMQKSITRAVQDLIDAGDDPLAHGFVRAANGQWTIGGRGTVKAFDFIKNATDDVLEGTYRNQVTGRLELDRRGNIWNQNLRELLQHVDDQSPAYAAARGAYAGPSKSKEALEVGRNILKGDHLAAQQRISRMTPGEKEFARAGAVQGIRDRIDSIRDTGNKAAAILRDENTRKRLRLLFDDDASFARFERMIRQEADRIDTGIFMRPDVGSQTAPRKEDVIRYGLRSGVLEDVRGGKPVRAVLGGLARRATDPFLNAAQQSRTDARGAAIADLLFSDPRNLPSLRMLARQQAASRGLMTTGQAIAGQTPAGGYVAGGIAPLPPRRRPASPGMIPPPPR